MAGALERQGAPRVDLGLDRLHPIRDPSPGEDPVEAADARDQELEVVDPVADRVGQLGQDAGGLVLFLADRLDEVVVGLDDGLGFDEEGLAALRAVVDDAPHATARLRPDGEDVPPVEARGRVRRSEEHTSELQSLAYLVCRLLLEKTQPTRTIRTSSRARRSAPTSRVG